MADLTISAGVYLSAVNRDLTVLPAGEAITLCQPVCFDTTGGVLAVKRAQARGTLNQATVKGLSVNAAGSSGQLVPYLFNGNVVFSTAILTQGAQYVLSHNAGKIKPISDLAANDFFVPIFFALSTTEAQLNIPTVPGVQWLPSAPTGQTATPGTTFVDLAWTNPTIPTLTWNVYRSLTTGTGYVLLASGLTSPAYHDTAVVAATPYFYVISASNVGGEGPQSTEVTATPT